MAGARWVPWALRGTWALAVGALIGFFTANAFSLLSGVDLFDAASEVADCFPCQKPEYGGALAFVIAAPWLFLRGLPASLPFASLRATLWVVLLMVLFDLLDRNLTLVHNELIWPFLLLLSVVGSLFGQEPFRRMVVPPAEPRSKS